MRLADDFWRESRIALRPLGYDYCLAFWNAGREETRAT